MIWPEDESEYLYQAKSVCRACGQAASEKPFPILLPLTSRGLVDDLTSAGFIDRCDRCGDEGLLDVPVGIVGTNYPRLILLNRYTEMLSEIRAMRRKLRQLYTVHHGPRAPAITEAQDLHEVEELLQLTLTRYKRAARAIANSHRRRRVLGRERLQLVAKHASADQMLILTPVERHPPYAEFVRFILAEGRLPEDSDSVRIPDSGPNLQAGSSASAPVSLNLSPLENVSLSSLFEPGIADAATRLLLTQQSLARDISSSTTSDGSGFARFLRAVIANLKPGVTEHSPSPGPDSSQLSEIVMRDLEGREDGGFNPAAMISGHVSTRALELLVAYLALGEDRLAEAFELADASVARMRGHAKLLARLIRASAGIQLGDIAAINDGIEAANSIFRTGKQAPIRLPVDVVTVYVHFKLRLGESYLMQNYVEVAAGCLVTALQMADVLQEPHLAAQAADLLALCFIRLNDLEGLRQVLARLGHDEYQHVLDKASREHLILMKELPPPFKILVNSATGSSRIERDAAHESIRRDGARDPIFDLMVGRDFEVENRESTPKLLEFRTIVGSKEYNSLVETALADQYPANMIASSRLAEVYFHLKDLTIARLFSAYSIRLLVDRPENHAELYKRGNGAATVFCLAAMITSSTIGTQTARRGSSLGGRLPRPLILLELDNAVVAARRQQREFALVALHLINWTKVRDAKVFEDGTLARYSAEAYAEACEQLGLMDAALSGYRIAIAEAEKERAITLQPEGSISKQRVLSPLHMRAARALTYLDTAPQYYDNLVAHLEAARARLTQYSTSGLVSRFELPPTPTNAEILKNLSQGEAYWILGMIPGRGAIVGSWVGLAISANTASNTILWAELEYIWELKRATVGMISTEGERIGLKLYGDDAPTDMTEEFDESALLAHANEIVSRLLPLDSLPSTIHVYFSPDSYIWDVPPGLFYLALKLRYSNLRSFSVCSTSALLRRDSHDLDRQRRLLVVAPVEGPRWSEAASLICAVAQTQFTSVTLLMGADATLGDVSDAMHEVEAVLFIGHGMAPIHETGLEGGWILQDAVVTASHIARMAPPQHLDVIALTCHGSTVGYSEYWPSRDVNGLAEAFLSIGARSYVGCMWPMDLATARILAQHWIAGLDAPNGDEFFERFVSEVQARPYPLNSAIFWAGVRWSGGRIGVKPY